MRLWDQEGKQTEDYKIEKLCELNKIKILQTDLWKKDREEKNVTEDKEMFNFILLRGYQKKRQK